MKISVEVYPTSKHYCSVDSYISNVKTPEQKFMEALGKGAKIREGSLMLPKSRDL